jgi:hypothetical protein
VVIDFRDFGDDIALTFQELVTIGSFVLSWLLNTLIKIHGRHESPSAHHHRVGPRLEQRQHIPVLYVPESVPSQGDAHSHLNGNASEIDHAVSRKSRIIGILVST